MAEEETPTPPSIHEDGDHGEEVPGVPTTRTDDEGKPVVTEH